METVRGDLKKILQASSELLSRAGSLQAPSWKFPEKLGVALNVEEALKQGLKPDQPEQNHFFILELIIDRLLLVLQCCVFELEGVKGQRSSSIPFTLGSTIRRLSKCVVQNSSYASDLKEQVSVKSKQIISLESSFSELQQECQSLQSKLQQSSAVTPASSTTKQSQLSSEPFTAAGAFHSRSPELVSSHTQTTDTAFVLCAQCSATQQGLLQSARLVTGLCERHNLKSRFSLCDLPALEQMGGLEVANWCEEIQIDVRALDESSRTLLERVEALSQERDQLTQTIQQLQNNSRSLDAQLTSLKDAQAQSESVLMKNKKEFAANMASLESVQKELVSRNSSMKRELDVSQQEVENLSTAMAELEAHRGQLEVDLNAMKKREEDLEASKQNLEEQLDSVIKQSQEAFTDSQVELNKHKMYSESLEKKYEVMKSKQSALLSRLDALDEECGSLRDELAEVESGRRELVGELQQVQARYEQMQTCYDQLQKQLSNEQDKLSETNQEQGRLNGRLSTLETQLCDAKEQVESEKRNCRLLMDYPFVKQTGKDYASHVTSIVERQQSRRQITANTIRILLLEEQNSELRSKSASEERSDSETTASLNFKIDSPLPLWDSGLISEIHHQHENIRRSTTKRAKRTTKTKPKQQQQHVSPESTSSQLPPRQIETIDIELPEHAFIRKSRSTVISSAPTPAASVSQRKPRSSGGRRSPLKGRLGHLVAAVSEAHRHATAPTSEQSTRSGSGQSEQHHVKTGSSKNTSMDIEVFVCDTCDRMFYQLEDMQKHSISCDKLT